MRLSLRSPAIPLAAVTGTLLAVGIVAAPAAAAQTACPDVEVIFARGTGELRGLGTVGRPFVQAVTRELSGYSVSSYAVDYAANMSQTSSGPGSADLVRRIESVAASCPDTRFVLGGYSQGATVVTKAVGVRSALGSATVIPDELSDRVAAVVAFGNPLGKRGRTIAGESATYGARSLDLCVSGDTVCDPRGASWAAHTRYSSSGAVAEGAEFAAALIADGEPGAGGGSAPDPGGDPGAGSGSGGWLEWLSSWRSGSSSGWSPGWGSGLTPSWSFGSR